MTRIKQMNQNGRQNIYINFALKMFQQKRDSVDLVTDNIQAKLDKIKKDFDRSARHAGSENSRHYQQDNSIVNIKSPAHGSELRMLLKEAPLGIGTYGSAKQSRKQSPAFKSPMRRFDPQATVKIAKPRKSLAKVLGQSPTSTRSFLSRVETHRDQVDATPTPGTHILSQALLAGKVSNTNRIGASGRTPMEENSKGSNLKMKYADKHRTVIQGQVKLKQIDPKKQKVVGIAQQLYTDVDSDHQQKMLHSNIYIPDNDSELKGDETHPSVDNKGSANMNMRGYDSSQRTAHTKINGALSLDMQEFEQEVASQGGTMTKQFSNMHQNPLYNELYQKYKGSSLQNQRQSEYLPKIRKKRNMDQNFNSYFSKRQMSVGETVTKNIQIELQKHGGPKLKVPSDKAAYFEIQKRSTKDIHVMRALKGKIDPQSRLERLSQVASTDDVKEEENIDTLNIADLVQELQPEKKFAYRSQSVAQIPHVVVSQASKKDTSKKLSLADQTVLNSQSRILKMISKPNLNDHDTPTVSHGNTTRLSRISEASPRSNLLKEHMKPYKEIKKKAEKKHERAMFRGEFEQLDLPPPKIDPRKIVLEMDLIDKAALEAEANADTTDMATMKNQDPNALDAADKIELVRRKLVCQEMGIEIPVDPATGDIDTKKLFEIQITQQVEEGGVQNWSPLKSEKQTASVIAMLEPMFPLRAQINGSTKELQIGDEKIFAKDVKKILEKKEPLTQFAELQSTDIQLSLKQGIFRERLESVNKLIDKRFEKASETFLDEGMLLKIFREQIKKEESVQGKPLFPMKSNAEFIAQWNRMDLLKNHQGVPISKTGYLMDAQYLMRQRRLQELEEKEAAVNLKQKLELIRNQASTRRMHEMMSDVNEETEDNLLLDDPSGNDSDSNAMQGFQGAMGKKKLHVNTKGLSSTQRQPGRGDLPIVPESEDETAMQRNLADQHPSQTLNDKSRKMLGRRLTSTLELQSAMSVTTPGFKSKIPGAASTMKSGSGLGLKSNEEPNFTSISAKWDRDPEIKAQLQIVENELLYTRNYDKNIQKLGIVLRDDQRDLLGKIHNNCKVPATGLDSQMGGSKIALPNKLAQKLMIKLMKEVSGTIVTRINAERLGAAMQQEAKEYTREQNLNKKKELLQKMAAFLQERQQENDVINYVIDKEANESDEEYNYFDQLAQGESEERVKSQLQRTFQQKLKDVRVQIKKDEAGTKGKFFIDPTKLDEEIPKSPDKQRSKDRMKFVPSARSPLEKSQSDFNKTVDKNYFDDNHVANQIPQENELQLSIQRQIADATQNLVLVSAEHQSALKKYLKLCEAQKVLPLPILNKLEHRQRGDRVLALEDYTISAKQVECLAKVLHRFGPSAFNKLYINNNGLDDRTLTTLLDGALKNPYITQLEIAFNLVADSATRSICRFLDPRKKQIRVLRLSNTKIGMDNAEVLLEYLSEYTHLDELKLQNFKFEREGAMLLGQAINNNISLKNLDLSWNQINPANFAILMKSIEKNKTVKDADFQYISCVGRQSMQIAESMYKFIRKNKSLIHLNLSYMGFGEEEVQTICEACSKCRTLVAIHLTGNRISNFPKMGEVDVQKKKIRRIMRPRKRMKDLREHVDIPDSDDDDIEAAATQKKMLAKIPQGDKANGGHTLPTQQTNMPKDVRADELIYSRVLGHFEMPQAHRWGESDHCWICEKHVHTVVLSSKSICEQLYTKPRTKDFAKYKKKIQTVAAGQEKAFKENKPDEFGSDCGEQYYDWEQEERDKEPSSSPTKKGDPTDTADKSTKDEYYRNHQIVGRHTNWKTRSMIPLYQFIRKLYKNGQNPVRVIPLGKDNQEERREIKNTKLALQKQMEQRRQIKTMKNLRAIKLPSKDGKWIDIINSKDQEYGKPGWLEELMGLLPYGNETNFVFDMDDLQLLDVVNKDISVTKEKVYAYATFLPPGIFNTCILYNSDEMSYKQKKKGMFTLLMKGQARKHNIDVKFKKVRQYKVERKFAKDRSVFRDWHEPDYQQLLDNDLKLSKVHRIIKDPDAYHGVVKLLHENIALLLDNWLYIIGHSTFSQISWMDFSQFCQSLNLLDANFTTQTIDICWASVTSNADNKKGICVQKDLCRYEFFEIFIRIAQKKYFETGEANTMENAVKMLLENHFMESAHKPQGGQQFREQHAWRLDVDDLIRANMDPVQRLYNHFLTDVNPATSKPYVELNLKQCLAFGPHLDLTDKQIAEAYSFAKQVPADEMAKYADYQKLRMVEFYDFIVRLAHMRFKNEQIPFMDKMEKTMDILFKIIDATRVASSYESEVSSESDYASSD